MLVMEDLLTTEEVARILKVSEFTVRNRIKAGQIDAVKLGGQWRVRQEALRRYIEAQQRPENNRQN
jgi:nitrogen PTS system EIIA component